MNGILVDNIQEEGMTSGLKSLDVLPVFRQKTGNILNQELNTIGDPFLHNIDATSTSNVFSIENMRLAVQRNGQAIYQNLTETMLDESEGRTFIFSELARYVHISLGGTPGTQEFETSIHLEIIKECIMPYIQDFFCLHGEKIEYQFPRSIIYIITNSISDCPASIDYFIYFLRDLQKLYPQITNDTLLSILEGTHKQPKANSKEMANLIASLQSSYNNHLLATTKMKLEADTKQGEKDESSSDTPSYTPREQPGIVKDLYNAFYNVFKDNLSKRQRIMVTSTIIQNGYEDCSGHQFEKTITPDLKNREQLWILSEAILETCRSAQEKNPAYRLSMAEHILTGLGYEGSLSEILRSSSHRKTGELEISIERMDEFLSMLHIDQMDSPIMISSMVHQFLNASHAINLICLSYSHDSPYVKAVLALKSKLISHADRLASQLQDEDLAHEKRILNTIRCKAILNYNWLERIGINSISDIEQQKNKITLEMKEAIEGLRNFSILTPEELAVFENVYIENRLLIIGFSIIRKMQFLSGSKKREYEMPIYEPSRPAEVITEKLFQDIGPDAFDKILDEAFVSQEDIEKSINILKDHLDRINTLLIRNIQTSPSYIRNLNSFNSLSDSGQIAICDLGEIRTSDDYLAFFCNNFPIKQKLAASDNHLQQLISSHILPNIVNILHFTKYTHTGINPELLEKALEVIVQVERGSPGVELYVNIGTTILDNIKPEELSLENSTQLIDWANALKDQLDTAGYYINEMPGIPRLYLALAQFYAGLPPMNNPEGGDKNLEKASQCVAIYIGSCGGSVPTKYEEFVNGLYEKIGKKQYQQNQSPEELRHIGTTLVQNTIKQISHESGLSAQRKIEEFFSDIDGFDDPDVDNYILIINQLCADLSIKLFSHNESIQLVKDDANTKSHDAWNKESIEIKCSNGDIYYLVFPYPVLRKDAFKKQFKDFEGEIFRLRDKIKEVLSRYEKTSGLHTMAHIVQLQDSQDGYDNLTCVQMNIGGIIRRPYIPANYERMPKLEEFISFIKDHARKHGLQVRMGYSRMYNTFYFIMPKKMEILTFITELKDGMADNLNVSVDFSSL